MKWTGQICALGTVHHLGTYSSELSAAVAYDIRAKEFNKEDSALNFPNGVDDEILFILQEQGFYAAFYDMSGNPELFLVGGSPKAIALKPSKQPHMPQRVSRKVVAAAAPKKVVISGQGDDDGDIELGGFGGHGGASDELPDKRTINKLIVWLLTAQAEQSASTPAVKNNIGPNGKRKYNRVAPYPSAARREQQLQERLQQQQMEREGLALSLSQDHVIQRAIIDEISNFRKFYDFVDDANCNSVLQSHSSANSCAMDACRSFLLKAVGTAPSKQSSAQLTSVEISQLCVSIFLIGAPLHILSDRDVVPFEIFERMGTFLPHKDAPDMPAFTVQDIEGQNPLPYFDWNNVARFAKLTAHPVEILKAAFSEAIIPFCAALLSTEDSLFHPNGLDLPNPLQPSSQHNAVAKHLCQEFIRRQHFLRVIQYFLTVGSSQLFMYLRCPVGRSKLSQENGMPAWWCPWIHDVGVMAGCLKHGFLSMDAILSDRSLPFHDDHLKKHIRCVFLYGSSKVAPAAASIFSDERDAEKWVSIVATAIPNTLVLEARIAKILSDLTQRLPAGHLLKVKEVKGLGVKPEVISSFGSPQPCMPLGRFLEITRKRRRQAVDAIHPEQKSQY